MLKLQPDLTQQVASGFLAFFSKCGINLVVASATACRGVRLLNQFAKGIGAAVNRLGDVMARNPFAEAKFARPHKAGEVHQLEGNKYRVTRQLFFTVEALRARATGNFK